MLTDLQQRHGGWKLQDATGLTYGIRSHSFQHHLRTHVVIGPVISALAQIAEGFVESLSSSFVVNAFVSHSEESLCVPSMIVMRSLNKIDKRSTAAKISDASCF